MWFTPLLSGGGILSATNAVAPVVGIKRVPTKNPRRTQPQSIFAKLNPKLLSKNLALAWIGSSLIQEGVKYKQGTITANSTTAPSSAGLTLKTNGASTTGVSFGIYQPATTNTWSVIILANPAASGKINTLYSQRATVTNTGFSIAANMSSAFAISNGILSCGCQDNTGFGVVFGFQSSASVIDGKFHIFSIVREGTSGNAIIYVDGKLNSTTGGLTRSAVNTTTQETCIGRLGSYLSPTTADQTASYAANCNIAAVLVFNNVALSAQEIAAFGSTPASLYGAMFAPAKSNLWMVLSGAIVTGYVETLIVLRTFTDRKRF